MSNETETKSIDHIFPTFNVGDKCMMYDTGNNQNNHGEDYDYFAPDEETREPPANNGYKLSTVIGVNNGHYHVKDDVTGHQKKIQHGTNNITTVEHFNPKESISKFAVGDSVSISGWSSKWTVIWVDLPIYGIKSMGITYIKDESKLIKWIDPPPITYSVPMTEEF
jgi:hypothetical protein